jgi:hypothetical protein
MNDSLLTADRATHLKMVSLALVCALIVVTVGMTARADRVSPEPLRSLIVSAR